MPDSSSPMVLGFHHVAVVVSDVSAAAKFYRKVFEFSPRKRLTTSTSAHDGAWFQVGTLELHLQERPGNTPKTDQHFALATEHIDEIAARARENGGRVEEARLLEGISKRCFVYDPDGNKIELLQK